MPVSWRKLTKNAEEEGSSKCRVSLLQKNIRASNIVIQCLSRIFFGAHSAPSNHTIPYTSHPHNRDEMHEPKNSNLFPIPALNLVMHFLFLVSSLCAFFPFRRLLHCTRHPFFPNPAISQTHEGTGTCEKHRKKNPCSFARLLCTASKGLTLRLLHTKE